MAWKHALRSVFPDGGVSRGGDIYKIEIKAALKYIRVVPGFNPRQNVGTGPNDPALLAAVKAGTQMDPLKVVKKKAEDGSEWAGIVDGGRRWWAIQKAIEEGVPIRSVRVVLANPKLNEGELLSMALSANKSENLTPSDEGRAFLRLRVFGWDDRAIAENQSVSIGTVANRIKLVERVAPALQKAVDSGAMTQAGALAIAEKSESIADQEMALDVSEEGKRTGKVSPSGRRRKRPAKKRGDVSILIEALELIAITHIESHEDAIDMRDEAGQALKKYEESKK